MKKESNKLTPKQIQEIQKKFVDYGNDIVGYFNDTKGSQDPEIRIIEQGAIPAAYYYRPAVVEAIRQEILKDHKAGQPIPPGAELINQEEDAENGKTEKISDPENDSAIGGDGSEPPKDGSNDGDQNSGGGASDPGGPVKSPPETGPGKKTPGEK
jgi:hypothetical protein